MTTAIYGREATKPGREAKMNGREKVGWSQEVWDRIDEAVHAECQRVSVAAKFLPLVGPIQPMTTTVPADVILVDDQILEVDETAVVPIVEIQRLFRMTRQQVEAEPERMTAVTLATRCGNLLSQAQDVLIFQGEKLALKHDLFANKHVQLKAGHLFQGLISDIPSHQVLRVPALSRKDRDGGDSRWGENAFAAVAEAFSRLQGGAQLSQAHYGPYSAVFHHEPYADAFAPLPSTLIMPADRIKPLVSNGFFGTGSMPRFRGLFMSTGNTADLVVAQAPTTSYLQDDQDGNLLFRVYARFALRLKDPSSVILLEFQDRPKS